jgi:phenylalanyl-tRNA synthetase alpha chain
MTTRKDWEKSWRHISDTALLSIRKAPSLEALETVRIQILGRQGTLTELLKSLKDLSLEERREVGAPANALRDELTAAIAARQTELGRAEQEKEIAETKLDLTLPGHSTPHGRIHPLTLVMDEMAGILGKLGFSWAEGPLIESDRYNFQALNIPEDHPARDMHDTFYVDIDPPGSMLLRTHTSPVQIRYMEANNPPLRIMAPGRVFRHEAVDASHGAVFHQMEGLYVDKNVTFADLKGTLQIFLQSLFGPSTKTRFRPSYYPFTEPSADVEISCIFCAGAGCGVCKRSGWIEVLGAGVVHPNVLRAVNLDPEAYSGFAFGMGIERIAMLKLGINDIRIFYQNDLRFLEQFE